MQGAAYRAPRLRTPRQALPFERLARPHGHTHTTRRVPNTGRAGAAGARAAHALPAPAAGHQREGDLGVLAHQRAGLVSAEASATCRPAAGPLKRCQQARVPLTRQCPRQRPWTLGSPATTSSWLPRGTAGAGRALAGLHRGAGRHRDGLLPAVAGGGQRDGGQPRGEDSGARCDAMRFDCCRPTPARPYGLNGALRGGAARRRCVSLTRALYQRVPSGERWSALCVCLCT
jgi:hypothetical protein